jgi:thiol-disulfide isomerase/thioredoxin
MLGVELNSFYYNIMKNPLRFLLTLGFIGVLTYGIHLFSQSQEVAKETTLSGKKVTLPSELLDTDGNEVLLDEIKGKYIGLYFSASWCGPCRTFTPKLVQFRDQNEENFEVVLVGSDGSAKAQANYMKKYKMPWLALKNQSDEARELSLSLDVEYIPYLIVLDPDGNVVTKSGKQDISRLGSEAFSSWVQKK